MKEITRDFISNEDRKFPTKIGNTLTSSLSGFIAGVIFASIIFGLALYFAKLMIQFQF